MKKAGLQFVICYEDRTVQHVAQEHGTARQEAYRLAARDMEWLEDMEKTTELEVTEFLVKGRKFLRGQLLGFDRHGFIIPEDYRGAFRKKAGK